MGRTGLTICRRSLAGFAVVGFLLAGPTLRAAEPAPSSPAASIAATGERLTAVLADVDAWLGDGPNADKWNDYLRLAQLRVEIVKGAQADPAVVSRTLQQFSTGASGLELAPFAALRDAIAAWRHALTGQFGEDLSKLAWASRGDFKPITDEQWAEIHGGLRKAAAALEQALGPGSQLETGWKEFLKWKYLEPHLQESASPSRRQLAQLDDVRRRIHANQPGLELPPFLALAQAIDRYRATVSWYGGQRDRRADYERLMVALQRTLERHAEKPTTETAWQIARILKIVQGLGMSPELMAAVVDLYGKSNTSVRLSAELIRQLPSRPLDGRRPVQDHILGTSIRGHADVTGGVAYELLEADDHVAMAIHVRGSAESQTKGYNDPVIIRTSGHTEFGGDKVVAIRGEEFGSTPSVSFVDTNTRIYSICKTGGDFGRKLIEKIAWQRAREQRPQAERISEGHTRERINREFDASTARELAASRARYEEKVAKPLIRRGFSPDILSWNSTRQRVLIESVLRVPGELNASGPPPAMQPGQDISLQIHESALNNFLPVALATATIAQEAAGVQPSIKGNTPTWLKVLAVAKPEIVGAAAQGAQALQNTVEAGKEAVEAVQETLDKQTPAQKKEQLAFRPWSITLNSEGPAAVRFDDDKLIIRIRAAQLVSQEDTFENWDFIVTYAITRDGDRILLKRTGDIEVFPTGFDPVWDRRMSSQQSGFRSTLGKNMNARAQSGQGFPSEIPIEPVRTSRFGTLVLTELRADDGWLTLGWKLP